jgi:hypothetical protein
MLSLEPCGMFYKPPPQLLNFHTPNTISLQKTKRVPGLPFPAGSSGLCFCSHLGRIGVWGGGGPYNYYLEVYSLPGGLSGVPQVYRPAT